MIYADQPFVICIVLTHVANCLLELMSYKIFLKTCKIKKIVEEHQKIKVL